MDWIDYAKGICIILVVMFHATHGVENAAAEIGWMHDVVAFAKPFRMPDFFLVSGLLLARVIDRSWRVYLDRKVVHFVYFYVLWLTIHLLFKAPMLAAEQGWDEAGALYLRSFVEPFAMLWFIYLLPVLFVVTKLLRHVHPLVVWSFAAALQIAPVPGWGVLDKFTLYFVYFYTGYLCADRIFAFARTVQQRPLLACAGLAAWGSVNGWLVALGYATYPIASLAMGFLGAAAVMAIAALAAEGRLFRALAYCGRHSIVIYLAFFIPMAGTRVILLRTDWITDIGTVSLVTTAAGVVGALALNALVRNTWMRFLFERPVWAGLVREPRPAGRPRMA